LGFMRNYRPKLAFRTPSQNGGRGLQFAAASALGGIGPEAVAAVAAMATLLGHPDPYVRQTAPMALGAIGPGARAALPALRGTLNDKEWVIRAHAAEAIFRIDPAAAAEAIPVLERLGNDPDPLARAEARRIIGLIGAFGQTVPSNVPSHRPGR
jgi:HEAT repeat protein